MACSVDSSTLFSFFRQPAACSEGSGTATVGTGMEAGVQNSAVQTAPPPWPLWLPLEQSALFAASSKGSWVLQMATHLWDRPANCFRVFILDPLSWRDHWFVLIGTLIFFFCPWICFFCLNYHLWDLLKIFCRAEVFLTDCFWPSQRENWSDGPVPMAWLLLTCTVIWGSWFHRWVLKHFSLRISLYS